MNMKASGPRRQEKAGWVSQPGGGGGGVAGYTDIPSRERLRRYAAERNAG